MPDSPSFVVNDRRKFTAEGSLRHDSADSAETSTGPQLTSDAPEAVPVTATQDMEQHVVDIATPALEQLTDLPESGFLDEAPAATFGGGGDLEVSDPYNDTDAQAADTLAQGPTAEEAESAQRAYEATVDRLDTAMRAADPGADRMPPMSFERLTQSLYTQTLLLLGGGTQPGEQPRVDILGARQTIDMLAIIAEKSQGNLTPDESKLIDSALFDLRMGFLEITQVLARQAAQRQPAPGAGTAFPGAPGGPRIVR